MYKLASLTVFEYYFAILLVMLRIPTYHPPQTKQPLHKDTTFRES